MMEQVVPTCCCAGQRREPEASGQAQAQGKGCCEQLAQPSRATTNAAQEPALEVSAPALAALLPVYAWTFEAASALGTTPRQARSPPSVGPPLFITHCSFLS
jgi:hypothetical protein